MCSCAKFGQKLDARAQWGATDKDVIAVIGDLPAKNLSPTPT
jgi:hypothetical protein